MEIDSLQQKGNNRNEIYPSKKKKHLISNQCYVKSKNTILITNFKCVFVLTVDKIYFDRNEFSIIDFNRSLT